MRRYRRMVLIDRFIPFLAALVGLVALAGSVVVQINTASETAALRAELAAMRTATETVTRHADALAREIGNLDGAADDGTAEALLALQDRMAKLEDAAKATLATTGLAAPAPLSSDPQAQASVVKPIDPNLPSKDCIPLDTRFMVTPGDSFVICQSKVVIEAASIMSDMVALADGTSIIEGSSTNLPGTNCTAMVFSADIEGFAEMRVNCQ